MLWLKVELIYGSKVGIFGRVFVFRSIFNNVFISSVSLSPFPFFLIELRAKPSTSNH